METTCAKSHCVKHLKELDHRRVSPISLSILLTTIQTSSNIVYMSASGRQNRNGLWKLVWQTSKLIQIFIYHGIYKLPFGLSWFCLDYISGTNAGSFEIYFVMNDIILSRCWAPLSCLIICTSRWVVYYAIFCQCWDLTPRWLACCCIFVFTLKILFWLSAEKKRISSIKTWKLTAASRGRGRVWTAQWRCG